MFEIERLVVILLVFNGKHLKMFVMDWLGYGKLIYHGQGEFSNGTAENVDGLKVYSLGEYRVHVVKYYSVCLVIILEIFFNYD